MDGKQDIELVLIPFFLFAPFGFDSLDLIEDYPDLLVKTNKKQKYTENDYFRIIWSRLFELLFNSSKVVRIKR